MAATQSVRVSTQRKTKAPEGGQKGGKYQAVEPAAAAYNVFAPSYAGALAQKTGATGADIMNMQSLHALTQQEQIRYAQDLAAAQAAQSKLQDADAYYGILGDNADNLQGDVELGMGGVRGAPVRNEYGLWSAPTDEMRVNVANANVLNKDEADRMSTKATGYGVLADKLGVRPSMEYLGKEFAPPTQETPVPFEDDFTSPTLDNTIYGTDQGLTAEQQMEIAAIKKAAAEDGDEIEASVTVGENGVVQTIYKGDPAALARRGIAPNGVKLNPNAGANSGTAPATPTAKPAAKQISVRPVKDGRSVFRALFPGVEPTQVERDPNSALGKKNPTSWHTRTKAAIDTAPIPGMNFNQYVQKYKDAGYEIIEQRDEIKNPSKHATGPHWHVVLGENREAKAESIYAQRLKLHPTVADVKVLDNGDQLVTLKSGKQAVYRKGKRIG